MRQLFWTSVGISLALSPLLSGVANAQTTPTTPIQHVVVIFNENISFDHYFGIYPTALNPPGQPRFTALPNTPTPNGFTPGLLNNNPNLNPANGTGAVNPFRLNRSQALTADQNHSYGPEQQSFDHGLMDLFPSKTGAAGGTPILTPPAVTTKGMVMGYYDGNTVTAMWNYAQHYAMSDNSYNTQFGPSTPGAVYGPRFGPRCRRKSIQRSFSCENRRKGAILHSSRLPARTKSGRRSRRLASSPRRWRHPTPSRLRSLYWTWHRTT